MENQPQISSGGSHGWSNVSGRPSRCRPCGACRTSSGPRSSRSLRSTIRPSGRGASASTSDQRAALEAILFRLRSGCQGNQLPQEFPDDRSGHRTLQRWQQRRVFDHGWARLVKAGDALGGVKWVWPAADGRLSTARFGGPDRAQPHGSGQERHPEEPAVGSYGTLAFTQGPGPSEQPDCPTTHPRAARTRQPRRVAPSRRPSAAAARASAPPTSRITPRITPGIPAQRHARRCAAMGQDGAIPDGARRGATGGNAPAILNHVRVFDSRRGYQSKHRFDLQSPSTGPTSVAGDLVYSDAGGKEHGGSLVPRRPDRRA